jgi:hypothetical protein
MILYVNGDSHAAAAECVNSHAWACDDPLYWGLGQQPHPDNLRASFGCELANHLGAVLVCDAQAGGSNARIMRTTRQWICANPDQLDNTLVLIQWSTWEREEWFHNEAWWQVNTSGTDHVPQDLQEKYRHYIVGIDWQEKTQQAHQDIWQFHMELKNQNIRHVFFNGNNDFSSIAQQRTWGNNYIGPYDPFCTYHNVIRSKGIDTVAPNSWHFGHAGHDVWYRYLLNYLDQHKFI